MRIVFLGDSLTAGTYGVGYVDKVAHTLPQVEAINAGINGDTVFNLLRRLSTDVIPHNPDGVLVMVGINDATSMSQEGNWPLYYRLMKGVPGGQIDIETFGRYYFQLLETLVGIAAHVWVALPPAENNPALLERLHQYNAEAARTAAKLDVPTLDLMAALAPTDCPDRPVESLATNALNQVRYRVAGRDYDVGRQAGGYTYTFDGVHLTEHGATLFAQAIVDFLQGHGV